MTIPQLHMYDLKTGEYTGSRDATRRPNGEYMLEATGATPVALPADIPAGHIARWTGDAWEAVEDHRQHMDERGRKEGGTPYWLPGDTWRSEPRYTEELGPLPTEALLAKPEKSVEELKSRQLYATCVAVIFPVCAVSAAMYLWRGGMNWASALPYLAGGLLGGWLGGKLYGRVSTKVLKWIFAAFLFYAGVRYLL